MDLRSILDAVDRLPQEELEQLRQHIEQRQTIAYSSASKLSAEQKLVALEQGFAALREGLTPEQLQAIIEDMNREYVEPVDSELLSGDNDLREDS